MIKADLRTTDTKERIIFEARQLYTAGGYNHLNLDVIAKTLKITRPALYFHFPGGKEQLLREVIKLFGTEIGEQIQGAIKNCPDVVSQLKNIIASVANQPMIDSREVCLAEIDDLSVETRHELYAVYQNVTRIITEIFEKGIERGELRPVNPSIAVFSFMGLYQQVEQFIRMRHYLPQELTSTYPEDIKGFADNLFDLWFRGIKETGSA
jgi:AcrR family transcriptional regulator